MKKQFDKATIISGLSFFEGLSPLYIEELVQRAELRTYTKSEVIYYPDSPSNEVFFLLDGEVKISTFSDDGREVIKNLLHPQSMFGELGLVGEAIRQNVAKPLRADAVVLCFKVEELQTIMRRSSSFSNRILNYFGARVLRAEQKLESLIFEDARSRIVNFIRNTVSQHGRQVGLEMLLKHSLTHQDIANITCTSRQTVTLVLNELKKSNKIYFNRGKILVRDIATLA